MKSIKSTFIVAIMLCSVTAFAQPEPTRESNFAIGFSSGYNRGFGINANLTAINPLESLDVSLRFGVGYTSLDPGSAADARRIFINNATNGVPEEKGRAYDYRMDLLWDTNLLDLEQSYIVVGPRYSSFRANFKYVGGNEDFDVTSKQIGLGLGLETHFKINNQMNLTAAAGFDYFFDNTLQGHDTSYSPDNDNVNPRNDNQNDNVEFTYSDADKSIKQPQFMPRILLGLFYKL